MKSFSLSQRTCYLHSQACLQLVFLGLIFALGAISAQADMTTVTNSVWKMKFGVSDAQIADALWLAADTDKDGVINSDEISSGTNPFDPGSVVKISGITATDTHVSMTFPAEKGKQYVVQGSPNLTSFSTLSPSVTLVVTSNSPSQTLTAPKGANKFFRVLVQDADTDGDGVSDWAENVAGYDPNNAADGGSAVLEAAVASSDVVTVTVTKPNALQPLAGLAPIETGSITLSRGGPLKFHSITVPLQKSGSATEGTDYDTLPNSVTFPVGVSEVVLAINPRANSNRKTNVTAIVKVLTGGSLNYTLGSRTSGSVVINPAGVANGTGLTAQYQNNASATYSSQTTIFNSATEMTRTDATVDFSSGVNGWGAVGGPTGLSTASTTGAFSVRWTGQILPQFSETYTIDFRSDDGAKVWVNGVLLIDRWFTQGATDYTNTIALQGGTLYDIQIEYFNGGTGSAEAKLYWWSESQVRQIIPQVRLFPAPTQAEKNTAITSSLSAVGFAGTPFNFSVTSANIGGSGTSYALAANSGALPPGLSLNAGTGAITGTPTTAGLYNVAIDATNIAAAAVRGSSIVDIIIYPAGGVSREILTASGPNVSDMVIPSPSVTPDHDEIATFDDDTEYANNTGERLRGYLVPPKTGNYYFWIAANNAAELWISNDSEYVNRVKRASLTAESGKKVWNTSASQRSAWLSLVAGQKYYFEVLHNTGSDADDHVTVGWCQDDLGTVPAVVGAPNATGALTLLPNGGGLLQGYPLSGTVPGYIFQPYDYPVVTPSTGTLYACNLGPQAAAATSASGSANLQVNANETQAILRFAYQNLTTPKTSYHLHVDGFTGDDLAVHPQGEIIYDIDDADQNPSEQTGDGGYIWDFRAVGSFSPTQLREALHKGKIYINIHSVTYPAGEIRGTFSLIDGSQTPPDAATYPAPAATDDYTNPAHAARFLNQATFGASPTDVAAVQSDGFQSWITGQLAKPVSRTSNDVVAGLSADINNPYPSSLFTDAWWKNSITGGDQLRQRLAFAISEIMVVSWANNTGPLQSNGRILADYYDQLVDYCLPTAGLTDSGNFRGILKQVTLTPAMGLYLDMRANQKGDATIGRHPNENYAREIMQLFSVGIYRTWDDGRLVLGSDAGLVSTYTQPSIIGLSNLFTGWNYAQPNQSNGRLPSSFSPGPDYLNPMVLVPTQHELSSKLLLNNVNSPAATGRTPRVAITSVSAGSPCTVNTTTIHGLKVGDTVMIGNVAGGTFSASINASHQVTEIVDADSFKVAVNLTAGTPTYTNAVVTGATVTPAAISGTTGIAAVTGSQADNAGTGANHPYDQYGLKELELAIDNIVNNDNVPPYICRQLIQRLVTSDPSPGYIYRVVQKFKNNGSGVRGDLAAVVSQILLDGEARRSSVTQTSTTFGKQREPVLRLTAPARAFPAANYTGTYTQLTGVNSNKLRIVTSAPNDFSSGFTVSLNFRGNYVTPMPSVPNPATNPTSTNYSVGTTTAIAATHLDISAISATGASPTAMTCTQPHGMGSVGQTRTIWLFGLSGKFSDASINSGGKTATVTGPDTFTVTASTSYLFQVASVAVGTPCTVTTVNPHGLPAGATTGVTINGIVGGTFSGGATSLNGTNFTVTNTGANTFTVASSSLTNVTCSVAPTGYTTWRQCSNPVRVTTVAPHGLANGDSVTISNVAGGNFSPTINGTFDVSQVSASAFTLSAVSCIAPSTVNTGNIVGANTMEVSATGMVNASYTQAAGSNLLTVNTGGPPTNQTVPGTTVNITGISVGNPCTVTTSAAHNLVSGGVVTIAGILDGTFSTSITNTFVPTVIDPTSFTVPVECTLAPTAGGTSTKRTRSKVYLDFLTQTTAGGAAIPADGVMEVLSNNGTTSFAIVTADTPTTARGGNTLLPKFSTSYSPSGTVIRFNTNVNHSLVVGDKIWVDVPVVGNPVTDAEYALTVVTDEDHFTTSRTPDPTHGGVYPNPSGSNNGITVYPLVPPPLGRSGTVVINQSTYNLGSTESSLSQSPLNAPTVFNYFFPDYKFPGTLANNGLDSPEFQLTTDTNVMNLTNSLTNMIVGSSGGNTNLNGLSSFNNGGGSVVLNIEPYMTNAKTSEAGISALVDELANLLVGAPLDASPKARIVNFVNHKNGSNVLDYLPYTTPTNQQKRDRVRAIIHLIITSAEFAVQK